jgi:hypothetical protein
VFGFFVLTSKNGFTDLAFEGGCLLHAFVLRLYRAPSLLAGACFICAI